jgi:glycosyltransferase involved in cell wall biosynthesis
MKNKICHITTLHPRYDVRIFHKECKSLSKKYEVHLIVADGKGEELKEGVYIHDVGLRQVSRMKRAVLDSKKAFLLAIELECELYHFHDPELTSIGQKLKKTGKKVIYDTHEDLPRQIESKPYLPKWLRPILSKIVEWQENKAAKKFDFICTATPFIRERFLEINPNTIDINNYPMVEELDVKIEWEEKKNEICYVGGLSKVRGIKELVKALVYIDGVKLNLAGAFSEPEFKEELVSISAWEKVNFLGYLNRNEISATFARSKAGIVGLHPVSNYLDSLPVKMFEYMIAGLPVIASNFPLWETIINTNKCGICIDPLSPEEISDAIRYILENPEEARRMGENGKQAVREKYNWTIEEKKLFEVYEKVLER